MRTTLWGQRKPILCAVYAPSPPYDTSGIDCYELSDKQPAWLERKKTRGGDVQVFATVDAPRGSVYNRAWQASLTRSRSIRVQRTCERTCEVRLSAPVDQEPEAGLV